ncbi:tryptophan synthase subunit alpha [Sutterella seckii]|uniref:Tryptophan synthase alpha chain n=1 Tax=Sutterella seckii TaxID=1944635 RepID=A0A6I1EJD7_9BURK|nr:tryptophan synthase subunit alpha [Sutterella seckii]KAB7658494.1 tryptophan synthase subunit alpha [Sutterella seckii]
MTEPNRFQKLFEKLRARREGAFVPFVNLCAPDPETSREVVEALIEGGADALELGIPFSDPCADGPVIEASAGRALEAGSTTEKCLAIVKSVREAHPELPISLMLYVNLVTAPGIDNFFRAVHAAGADAVLIPDVPISMREREPEWDEAAAAAGVSLVAIAPPKAAPELLRKVAERSKGYVYLLSRTGITGTDRAAEMPLLAEVEALRAAHSAPLLLGFGISKPEHVEAALKSGADGAIAGSAVTKIIAENLRDKGKMLASLRAFVKEMKAAARLS